MPISTDDSYGVIKRSDIVSAYNLPAKAPHDQMVDAVTAFETGNSSIMWDGVKVISAGYNSSDDKIFVQFAGEPLILKTFENLDSFYIRTIASSTEYAELQGGQARIFNSEGTYIVLSTEGVQSDSTLRTSADKFSIKGEIRGYSLVLRSSTKNSTKKFKITVDDSGTISATEVT